MSPRRRGRPPKQPAVVQAADDESDDDACSVEAPTLPAPAAKRRGRPPKAKPSPAGDAKAKPGKPRGRPPKPKPIEAASATPPKRRGRPPKPKPSPPSDDESTDAEAATPPEPAQRRGRPSKRQQLVDEEKSTSPKRPRPRGRPPKARRPPDDESMAVSSPSSGAYGPRNGTSVAEKGLVAAMRPLSLKRKAEPAPDVTPFKRARRGRVVVFGTGECAQLGLTEDRTERKFPTPVALNDRIVAIACGGLHTVAVTDGGEVWTWGCNDEKALGRTDDEWIPGKVDLPVPVVKVTAGDSHSMALGVDGRVYTWGAYRDTNGLMGFNPNTGEPCAQPIPVFLHGKRAIDIASGVNHSLVLLENGHVFEWGHIRIGQRVARHHRMNLLQPRLVNVRSFGRVVQVFAGAYQSFALTASGKVYAFGMNQYGQSGVREIVEQLHKPEEVVDLRDRGVVRIAGGLHHSLALLADGRVLSFGRNNYGELGMGDLEERRTPTLVPGLENIVDIGCGSTHSLAVSMSGEAYSCGFGEMLQLGNGEAQDRTKFEKIGGHQLDGHDVIACAAGAQHSVLVVSP